MAQTQTTYRIRAVEPHELEIYRHQIVAVYQSAFAAPPYSKKSAQVLSFSGTLVRHADRGGFRLLVAQPEETSNSNAPVVGFVYGYTSAPGQWWHDIVSAALGPDQSARWLGRALEMVELAVAPPVQGQGLGGRLHDALLVRKPGPAYQTAVLSTLQAETAGLHLYRRRGWETLLPSLVFPGTPEPYIIMGKWLEGGVG